MVWIWIFDLARLCESGYGEVYARVIFVYLLFAAVGLGESPRERWL